MHLVNAKICKQYGLPESLTTIRSQAFSGCSKLGSLTIGESVTTIEPLFNYSSGIKDISIDSNNPNYTADDLFLYNKDKTIIIKSIVNKEEMVIPEGVVEIGNLAFHGGSIIKKVTFSSSVKKIGDAFNYCTSLISIDIPETVEELSSGTFNNCDNLTEIRIHKPKDSIKGSPFGCPYGERAIIWNKT